MYAVNTWRTRGLLVGLALLAVIGLAGCSGVTNPLTGAGPFVVSGIVKQTANGTPITGISVTVSDQNGQWNVLSGTGTGVYSLTIPWPTIGDTITVTASDIDGSLNGGTFAGASQSIPVTLTTLTAQANFSLSPQP